MSLRSNGSYIGPRPTGPTNGIAGVASGIWDLRSAQRQRAAGAWPLAFSSPTQITGLQLWLDASDADTLFDATSGGSLVAADGGVARWEDKSGNGRHATQGTSANRPARKTAIQGGKDVLRFDGLNDYLDGAATPGSGNARTAFVISKSSNTSGGAVAQIGEYATNATRVFLLRQGYSSPNTFIGGDLIATNVSVNSTQLNLTSFHMSVWRQTSSTRAVSYWHSGTLQTVTGTPQSFTAGAGYLVGALIGTSGVDGVAGNPFEHFPGDIAEILIYDSELSDTDREAVEDYLLAKWAIT